MLLKKRWFGGGASEERRTEEGPLELDTEVRCCCSFNEEMSLHNSSKK